MMGISAKRRVLFFIISILLLPIIYSDYMKIHYSGQDPSNGILCTLTPACESIGAGFNTEYCCTQKACEQESTYYYTFFTPEGSATSGAAYTINYDTMPWACNQCKGMWEKEIPLCCGDDIDDDPDWGEDSCNFCPVGQFGNEEQPSIYRHWSTNNLILNGSQCCGDDPKDCGEKYTSSDGKVILLCSDRPGKTTISTTTETTCDNPEDEECQQQTTTSQNIEYGPWYWKDARNEDSKGMIWDSVCSKKNNSPQISYLNSNEEWVACTYDNTYPGKIFDYETNYGDISSNEVTNPYNSVLEHGYICYLDNDAYRIAECCGSSLDNCDNNYLNYDFGGVDLLYGGSVVAKGKYFFCNDSLEIATDLDSSPIACDNSYYVNGSTISGLGYRWTGTKCCAEPEDGSESYNDFNGTGACFNRIPVMNGHIVPNMSQVATVGGVLTGCNISNRHNNEWLLDLKDNYTNEQLIIDSAYCTVDSRTGVYCDYSGKWNYTGENRSNLIYAPESWDDIPEEKKAGCCKPTDCWNGSKCFDNQAKYQPPDVRSLPVRSDDPSEGYRCADGMWVYSRVKPGIDGTEGFCPREEQCFVSRAGKYEFNNNPNAPIPGPQCITDGQYIEDYYCEKGIWSSRTKKLGLSLLSIVSNPSQEDYVLYCGFYTDVLNYFSYTMGAIFVKNLFVEGDINNLCVLDSNGKIILAASVNTNFSDTNFKEALQAVLTEYKNCNMTKGPGFVSCSVDNKAWFNKNLQSIVYSKKGFEMPANPNFDSIFSSFIKQKLAALNASLRNNKPTDTFTYGFMIDDMRYDYLYLAKKGNKNAFATMDTSELLLGGDLNPVNIIVRYEGQFSANISQIIYAFNKSKAPKDDEESTSEIAAADDNSVNIIVTGGLNPLSNIYPYGIWPDLTGKLRIQ